MQLELRPRARYAVIQAVVLQILHRVAKVSEFGKSRCPHRRGHRDFGLVARKLEQLEGCATNEEVGQREFSEVRDAVGVEGQVNGSIGTRRGMDHQSRRGPDENQ